MQKYGNIALTLFVRHTTWLPQKDSNRLGLELM